MSLAVVAWLPRCVRTRVSVRERAIITSRRMAATAKLLQWVQQRVNSFDNGISIHPSIPPSMSAATRSLTRVRRSNSECHQLDHELARWARVRGIGELLQPAPAGLFASECLGSSRQHEASLRVRVRASTSLESSRVRERESDAYRFVWVCVERSWVYRRCWIPRIC